MGRLGWTWGIGGEISGRVKAKAGDTEVCLESSSSVLTAVGALWWGVRENE